MEQAPKTRHELYRMSQALTNRVSKLEKLVETLLKRIEELEKKPKRGRPKNG